MSARLPAGTIVLADAGAVAAEAARRICGLFAARPAGAGLSLCLAGGSTPQALYGLLAAPPWRDRVPWSRIDWFLGDERLVPPAHPDSNLGMARAAVLARAPIPAGRVHAIPTGGGAEAGADAYGRELARFHGSDRLDPGDPLFDVVLLGLGPDGHTASLFPGTAAAEEETRWVAAVPEPGQPPRVPRISLTRPALGSCRLLLMLVTGAGKRDALARIGGGEALPGGRIEGAGETVWLADRDAAGGEGS